MHGSTVESRRCPREGPELSRSEESGLQGRRLYRRAISTLRSIVLLAVFETPSCWSLRDRMIGNVEGGRFATSFGGICADEKKTLKYLNRYDRGWKEFESTRIYCDICSIFKNLQTEGICDSKKEKKINK